MTNRPAQPPGEKPVRIQRRWTKGWRMPPNTVYVGDPSRWGNPFHGQIREIGREAVVGLYAGYLAAYFGFTDRMVLEAFRGLPVQSTDFDEWIAPLRGKNLACWCPTSAPCHADVLLEIANR